MTCSSTTRIDKTNFWVSILLVAISLGGGHSLWAQRVTATLTGKVTDPSGASISKAAVTVTNDDTGVLMETQTSKDGTFAVPQLPPGRYSVAVEQAGFKTLERHGIILAVDQTANVNLGLEVGASSETVEVTSQQQIINTQTSDNGAVVDKREILNLPLNQRNPLSLVLGANGLVQGGSNGDVVVADALVKGLAGIHREDAYWAVLKDATVQSDNPLMEGRELHDLNEIGYMSLSQMRSATRTLEYAYDDFAVAETAKLMGDDATSHRLLERSQSWKKLWDAEMKCIHPRYRDGSWLENFDCDREYPDNTSAWWDAPFYEGSARQYSTFVPHDVPGLIEKLGGDDAFVKWLDDLFDHHFYNQGNEPDLLAPYLYIYAGRPDRTAERVKTILTEQYKNSRTGLPGNDDAGTMSSWYVWSAIGLYPNAGQPYYLIGSPIFDETRIDLGGGKAFTIAARRKSPQQTYVERAELNGKVLNRAWLTHDEIVTGRTLTLVMSEHPSQWATILPSTAEEVLLQLGSLSKPRK